MGGDKGEGTAGQGSVAISMSCLSQKLRRECTKHEISNFKLKHPHQEHQVWMVTFAQNQPMVPESWQDTYIPVLTGDPGTCESAEGTEGSVKAQVKY